LLPSISAVSSQEASHKTGLEISALDINYEKTHAILAGREILKTIRIFGTHCSEEINLRAAIINYAAHNASGSGPPSRRRDAFEIHDVKWSHGQYSSHIATAAASGNVILYDLNRAGVELARLHEHHRQVHKVAFNPHQGYLLLSGSQDATVRLWDLREMRKDIMTCASRDRYSGAAEAVRDLKWSPTDGVEFAFGTDSGVIQRWDYRMTNKPKLKIQAHDKTVNSIDWHLDGKHVLSASIDKTVRVWDFSSEARRQKPAWVIRTPFAVYNARWRPPSWYAGSHDVGSWRCTQLATSYDRDHGAVHVWDLRRPFLPFREIHRYNTAPTDMLWHSRDLLWTVGREGMFTQNDVHFSPKLMERRNMQAFAVSSSGEVGGFTQKRPRRRGSGLELLADDPYASEHSTKRESPEKNSLGRSSADDTVDESFLSSSFKRHHGRTASNRSAKSYGSTPPSYDATGKVMLLQESLETQAETSKPHQVAFRGLAPGFTSVPNFTFLAQKYKAIPLPDPPTLESFANLSKLFEQNAEYARRASLYRQAQTWMLIGHWLSNVVNDRADEHRRLRVEQRRRISSGMEAAPSHPLPQDGRSLQIPNATVRAIQGSVSQQHQSNQTAESTSNLPTPLAKPIPNSGGNIHASRPILPDPDKDESISLPPAIAGPHSQENKHLSAARGPSLKIPTGNFNGANWFNSDDLDERRAIAGSYRAQPRTPLTLEPVRTEAFSIIAPPPLGRHNSDESFAMFSSSSDSQKGPSMASSYASHKSYSNNMASIPEKWQESLPGSSSGEGHSDASDSPTLSRRMSMGAHDLHVSIRTLFLSAAA
jgi:WD repeat-containing protein 24